MSKYTIVPQNVPDVLGVEIRDLILLLDSEEFNRITGYDAQMDIMVSEGRPPRPILRFKDNYIIGLEKVVLDAFGEDDRVIFRNDNPLDLRKENLKLIDKSDLFRYRKTHSNNVSGYPGVSWLESRQRWRVVIKDKYYGSFRKDELDLAINVAKQVREGGLGVST